MTQQAPPGLAELRFARDQAWEACKAAEAAWERADIARERAWAAYESAWAAYESARAEKAKNNRQEAARGCDFAPRRVYPRSGCRSRPGQSYSRSQGQASGGKGDVR